MGKWLDKARTRKSEIESEKSDLLSRIESITNEKASLLNRIAATEAEKDAKINAYKSGKSWSDLNNNDDVPIDTMVIYFGRWYQCILTHNKSILRLPTNNRYWIAV